MWALPGAEDFSQQSRQEAQLLLGWPTHGAKNDFRIRDLEMTRKPRSKVIADSEHLWSSSH